MNKFNQFELDPRFLPHNSHHRWPQEFADRDPQLSVLRRHPLVHRFALLDALPRHAPGIYSVTGGRQLGKTTLVKQWMLELLSDEPDPRSIVYLTGELLDDHHSLVTAVTRLFNDRGDGPVRHLCIDEVTYIKEWDRGIKYLADAGFLEGVTLLLTGSDSVLIREARMRLPGRRGGASVQDFHLFPLSLCDFVRLTETPSAEELGGLEHGARPTPAVLDALALAFDRYLISGGYLRAINELQAGGTVSPATYAVYCDWIRGDVAKRGKRERYLREVLAAVSRRMGSQVTWNGLAGDLSIDHPATIAEYIDLLARMDVLIVIPALAEHRLSGAPKKARKVVFADPFIYHAVQSWLGPTDDPFRDRVIPVMADSESVGRLAELCADVHYSRRYPTFYIKAEGEVDIAYVSGGRFHPVEVKWTGQVRSKDMKQLQKYDDPLVLSRQIADTHHGIRNRFLPLHLFNMGPSPFVWPEG
ncbi:MAG: ATP-binding protein [Spirochaetota bacterium]